MNVLFVGAHLDDIELGCGASFMRHVLNGDKVIVDILTNSEYVDINTDYRRDPEEIKESIINLYSNLNNVIYRVMTELPLNLTYSTPLAQSIERTIKLHKIDRIYYHSNSDINTDHLACHELCKVAARNVPSQFLFSANWYRDDTFHPNIFLLFNKNEYNEWKINRLKLMKNEWKYRNKRWKNEIFDWERHWGNRLGNDYAEGFMGRVVI